MTQAAEKMFTAKDVAKRWKCAPTVVHRMVESGHIARPRNIAGKPYWSLDQILAAEEKMHRERNLNGVSLNGR